MIETVFTKPMVHYRINKFFEDYQRQVIGGPIDEDAVPQWIKDRYGIAVIKNPDGTYVFRTLDTLVPVYEAYPLFTLNLGGAVLDKGVGLLTPILKIPIEALTNKSLYTNRNIQNYSGEPAIGYTYSKLGFSKAITVDGPLGIANLILNEHIFKGIGRPIDVLAGLVDSMIDDRTYTQAKPFFWAGLLDIVIGKSNQVSPEETREWFYTNWKKTEKMFKNQYEYALRHGDEEKAKFFSQLLNELRLTKPKGLK
jgi:hypothetical protein